MPSVRSDASFIAQGQGFWGREGQRRFFPRICEQKQLPALVNPCERVARPLLVQTECSDKVACPFVMSSSSFVNNGPLPIQFTCDGATAGASGGVSPDLQWLGIPCKAKSLALIVDSPSSRCAVGKTLVHWYVVNIPITTISLPVDVDISTIPPAQELRTDFCTAGNAYFGPCPSTACAVIMRFTLFALDEYIMIAPFALTAEQFARFMRTKILAVAQLQANYTRCIVPVTSTVASAPIDTILV